MDIFFWRGGGGGGGGGVHHEIGLYLGVISMHFRSFLYVKDIWGVAKISIF